MKGSILHRSALSKERMAMLENIRPNNLNNDEIPQYEKAKTNELDLLYKNVEKTFINAKSNMDKTPAAYLLIGFITGILFTLFVVGIILMSSKTPGEVVEKSEETNIEKVEVQPEDENTVDVQSETSTVSDVSIENTYTVKQGDTIDKIATKIYGNYDVKKIEEIQRINNIKDPSKLQLGQILKIPAER